MAASMRSKAVDAAKAAVGAAGKHLTKANAVRAAKAGGNVAAVIAFIVVLFVVAFVAAFFMAPNKVDAFMSKLPEWAQSAVGWTVLIVVGIFVSLCVIGGLVSLGSKGHSRLPCSCEKIKN